MPIFFAQFLVFSQHVIQKMACIFFALKFFRGVNPSRNLA